MTIAIILVAASIFIAAASYIYYVLRKIKTDEKLKNTEEKALKNNVSIEEQLKLDATWTLENRK